MQILEKIPAEVKFAIEALQKSGFEAYIVGGCVRDLMRGIEPGDWDLATNAKPEEIQEVFPDNYADNKFGTIKARIASSSGSAGERKEGENFLEIEITPYRTESEYSDMRHPDKVEWVENIKEDLARRDFTVNAIALSYIKEKDELRPRIEIIDLFDGRRDLEKKIIKAVRDPNERFSEDALRMMRAARFAVTLGKDWIIGIETAEAIKKNARLLENISKERVRDEFLKIMGTDRADEGIELLRELGLLKYVIPELVEAYNVGQNKHHVYDVYKHSLYSLKFAAKSGFNIQVKIATLLHDIGKPRVKQGEGPDSTFYNHEIVGAKMAKDILNRLKFPKKEAEKIIKLVRYHLFYYNVGEVSESSVRRLVRNVEAENVEELLQVRMADRIGSGCPKAEPYKLRHLRYLIEKTSKDAISVKKLRVSGQDVMEVLKITPGPRIGQILNVLLAYALENPRDNSKAILSKKINELGKLKADELEARSQAAKKEIEAVEMKQDQMTKKKYWVT